VAETPGQCGRDSRGSVAEIPGAVWQRFQGQAAETPGAVRQKLRGQVLDKYRCLVYNTLNVIAEDMRIFGYLW